MILALSPRVNFVVDKESIDCLSPSILADRKCREISCFLFIISSFFHAWLFFFPMMFMASERKPFSTLQTLDFHSVWMPQVFCFAHWHFYLHIIHLHVHVILWSNRSQGVAVSTHTLNTMHLKWLTDFSQVSTRWVDNRHAHFTLLF